jgi:hypothetical protein
VYEDNITECTVSCWIIGEQGYRERVNNGGLIWLKCDVYKFEIPRQNPFKYHYALKKWRPVR